MSRKHIQITLPSFDKVFPAFPKLGPEDNKQQIVTEKLRTVARRFRSQKSRPFYTMRDVAEFFSAPLRTVAITYETLEREGLLTRIRGTHTLLNGRQMFQRVPIRGVIGLPICLNTLVLSSYTRQVNMELEKLLRKQGFVANLIFHHTKREEAHPDFAEQLVLRNLDAVIWNSPHPRCEQNVNSLHESGVRVLLLQALDANTNLPAVIYQQDWSPGYREIAQRWSESGVKKVTVPVNPDKRAYRNDVSVFTEIVQSHGMSVEICGEDVTNLVPRSPAHKSKQENVVAFLELTMADHLCNREPLAMERLAQFSRLALCRGQIRCPYLQHRGVQFEVVNMVAEEISKKLVEDIQILPNISTGIRHVFKSRYYPDNSSADLDN